MSEKVKVLTWDSVKKENVLKDCQILHWGITYIEMNNGTAPNYTVVFVKLPDGSVYEAHPSQLQFEESNNTLEDAAPEMLEALKMVGEWLEDDTSLPSDDTITAVWSAIKKATGHD